MAWSSTEDFEGGSNGASVYGTSGGSGWSDSWSKAGGDVDWLFSNSSPLQGSLSASHTPTSGSDTAMIRSPSSTFTSGVLRFMASRSLNNNGELYGIMRDAGGWVVEWQFSAGGQIVFDGSNIQAYSASTAYTFLIEYDASTDQARISINGGAYSSWANVTVSTGVTQFRIVSSNSTTVVNKCDYIGDGASTAHTKTLTETPVATDTVPKSTTRTLTESKTATDTFSYGFVILATLSETVTVLDTLVRSIVRTLSEAPTATDTFLKNTGRTFVESVTASDVLANAVIYAKTLTETVTAIDTKRILLNGSSIIWSHLAKSADAAWSKITKATTNWTHVDKP